MAASLLLAIVALVGYWAYSNISGLQKSIAAAKRSGLPYVIAPTSLHNVLWMITNELWIPLIKKLPKAWWENWIDYMTPDWTWQLLYDGFKPGDAFIVASPGGVQVYLANAEAISQITSRREAFPKPLGSYKILEVFGRNVITTEGAEWKAHRRIVAPSFTEKNNVLVFKEATKQTEGMMRKWMSLGTTTITEVPTDTMRLTLHVISKIGFGVSLLWPGETLSGKQSMRDAQLSSNEPAEGHTMSFENSINTLLEYVIMVLLVPTWLLKRLPFKGTKEANESYVNWKQYMEELLAQKIQDAREGKTTEGMDFMGTLVRNSYGTSGVEGKNLQSVEKSISNGSKPAFSDSEIMGNAFVMIVAGHETTANSLHFSLIELAINPKSQREIQKEVTTIFADTPSAEWDYESNINRLLGGMVGAVLNEQLRLMPPVIAIPKHVTASSDQSITIDGKKIILPARAHISLATSNVHRNPRYWPTQPSIITDRADDLNDFKPERWLAKTAANGDIVDPSGTDQEGVSSDSETESFTGQNAHAALFRPVRGSYLPFSEGPRSCVGRRLAQVKIMAVLAVIFQKHSIELAVDEWATDEEVSKMSTEQKKALYQKAKNAARETIRGATSRITLKLHPGFIPVRVMKRGDERFVGILD